VSEYEKEAEVEDVGLAGLDVIVGAETVIAHV
jgi:hypothetical protein